MGRKPTLKRIRAQQYFINPKNNRIFGFYTVLVTWPDGRRRSYDSEEHALAAIESRSVDKTKLNAEISAGFQDK
ncbi:MAG TPA: hypothetical protein VMX17_12080 [Candidatus Glassbacteria bacterium]|nr:hypothetical protein [Candidatus Glassbacteria bacterium]